MLVPPTPHLDLVLACKYSHTWMRACECTPWLKNTVIAGRPGITEGWLALVWGGGL